MIKVSGLNKVISKINQASSAKNASTDSRIKEYARLGEAIGRTNWQDTPDSRTVISSQQVGENTYQIIFEGEQVAFIEFGTGITHSGQSHPTGMYGAGTFPTWYPNNVPLNWENPDGWFYRDDSGGLHHTYGNPAGSQAYLTAQELRERLLNMGVKNK